MLYDLTPEEIELIKISINVALFEGALSESEDVMKLLEKLGAEEEK